MWRICDTAGSNSSHKRLPAHAPTYKFDASWRVQNACQRDLALWTWVLIAFVLNKRIKYVPPQPRIPNPDSYRNFLAKIYATNLQLAELTFFSLICRLLRLEQRSQDGSEMASSSTKLFEASCASKLKFFIIFGILPLSLPNVPLNWLEQTEYHFFFFHGSTFFEL